MSTTVAEHEGLGYAERGTKTLLGDLGHWHRYTDSGAERRRWVRGTAEACETGLSDEDLLAKIREADETFDPAPEFKVLPSIGEAAQQTSDSMVRLVEAVEEDGKGLAHYQAVKPERGGKRVCVALDCGHSESRHNASGSCRTCDCEHFTVTVS